MKNRPILLVGMQGTGKTWVMLNLIAKYQLNQKFKFKQVYYHCNPKIVVIGKYDGTVFQGSDKLSMSVMADMSDFIANKQGQTIILEGDRFTNNKFIARFNPKVVLINNNGQLGRQKRGTQQTERAIKAMATRIKNLKLPVDTIIVNTSNEALNALTQMLNEKD